MGLCSHPVGCLAWGIPTLNSTGCWVGPGLGEKWRPRRMTHADEYSLELLPPLSLPLHWATLSLYLYKRLSRTSRSVWYRFFMRSQLFSLGPGYHKTVVPFKRGVSVAPSPVEFLQVPQTFKARFSRASSPYCQNTPKLGSLMRGSKFSLLRENFCCVVVLQFVGHLLGMYRFWLCLSYHLTMHFSLFLYVGYLFW